jgi:hypothetical protein
MQIQADQINADLLEFGWETNWYIRGLNHPSIHQAL